MDPNIEDDTVIEQAPAEVVAPRDEVNNDVRAAIESLKNEAPAEAAEPVAEKPAVERARAPDGKFVAKDATTEPIKDAAPVKAAAPTIPPPVDDPTKASTQQPNAAAPPVSWAADVKQLWPTLPPAIQAAVLKREAEVSSGFKQKSDEVRQYQSVLAPVAEAAQARGITVDQGVQSLMAAQQFLDRDPRAAISWLAENYGVDLADLASNPPAPQQQARPDPVVAQLYQTVSSLQERIAAQDFQANLGTVESFAGKHPHWADVEDQIPALMKEIRASNSNLQGQSLLEAAYDRAVWLNPTVRAKLISEQQAEAARTAAQQVQQKAAQANRAAVSVRGSTAESRAPARPQANGSETVYDDVRRSIDQLRAG